VSKSAKGRARTRAIYSDEIGTHKEITYGELFREVCQVANVLKNLGIKKGDVRVARLSLGFP
jgi:acetyl-CoA synthetase